ncbi:tellurite resistance TerB family protein [Pusillimonas sp. MFBS29]|uniref:tellurite resistance TerB family protein n=1 Tax=Pusillimonas sp. MFBS29 TaxID=2886690 RepID=UPI001D1233E8|nr:tellurite resistance TerB family protein [Pusillimonas sp. MFBS29]MCC2596386.1 tellurite resistance TerB family protein [Pusillimonas sp. MFBS29]
MSIQQLLQQVLQSGQSLIQDAGSQANQSAPGLSSKLGGFGGGALAGGALGLLLGNKKFRKMGGKFVTYGGAAALGALALKTYQDWQQQKPVAATAPTPLAAPALPAGTLEDHSRIILAAMIAAAKADGHIGNEERALLDSEVARLSTNASDRAWFEAELAKPADPGVAASLASTPEQAAEVYLASLLVIDEQSYMERAYLDELARRLPLPDGLKEHLEAQAHTLA